MLGIPTEHDDCQLSCVLWLLLLFGPSLTRRFLPQDVKNSLDTFFQGFPEAGKEAAPGGRGGVSVEGEDARAASEGIIQRDHPVEEDEQEEHMANNMDEEMGDSKGKGKAVAVSTVHVNTEDDDNAIQAAAIMAWSQTEPEPDVMKDMAEDTASYGMLADQDMAQDIEEKPAVGKGKATLQSIKEKEDAWDGAPDVEAGRQRYDGNTNNNSSILLSQPDHGKGHSASKNPKDQQNGQDTARLETPPTARTKCTPE